MFITASIVTHRPDRAELQQCIECVLRCPLVRTLYLIDNSPDNGLQNLINSPRTHYEHVANDGYGAGHNIAIRRSVNAGAFAHLVLNADTVWQGDVISDMVQYMAHHPEVGMMMPKVYYPDGSLQLTARRLPTPYDLIAKRFLPSRFTHRRMSRYLLACADHDKIINSPYLPGSFLLLRGEAIKRDGMFDERFFMYPEDIDLTRRFHRHWLTIHYPSVSIIHRHNAASRRNLRMLGIHLVNMMRYFNKWGWIHDSERKKMNQRLEAETTELPDSVPTPKCRG